MPAAAPLKDPQGTDRADAQRLTSWGGEACIIEKL